MIPTLVSYLPLIISVNMATIKVDVKFWGGVHDAYLGYCWGTLANTQMHQLEKLTLNVTIHLTANPCTDIKQNLSVSVFMCSKESVISHKKVRGMITCISNRESPCSPNLGSLCHPMVQKRHLWPRDLTPVEVNESKNCYKRTILDMPSTIPSFSLIRPAISELISSEQQDHHPRLASFALYEIVTSKTVNPLDPRQGNFDSLRGCVCFQTH